MISEYELGLRFDKKPRKKRSTPDRSDLGNLILTMTDKEIFNTFATVVDSPTASPFLKRLAQAGLVAMPDDKTLILRTWPRIYMQYGPHSEEYRP
tara:strand:- start:407 stop:691 length:285 start_codon:yes stop_codon:yes gene_type:complete